EIALLEPPASGQRSWRVRPFMRTTRLLRNYPLGAPVTVTLSAKSNPPFLWTWPKGEAVRSDLLIFIEDENATPQQPMLRFIKAGSVRSPHKTLYALIPDDWQVEPSCDGAVTEIEAVPGLGCKLVRLSAAAYFTASDDE